MIGSALAPAMAPRRALTVPAGLGALAPSLILFLCLCLWLLATSSDLLGDPDTQWHIAVGRWIWAARGVPTSDAFSHTQAGAPWIAKEWLSQLVFFGAYSIAGWRGVMFLTIVAIAGSFALLHGWLRRRVHPTAALAAVLVAIALAQGHFLARPHMLILPIVVVWMIGLVRALERGSAPPLGLALAMMLWADMHGSFPLGLVMAGILAGEGVLFAPAGTRRGAARRWALFLAVALGAAMVSPYGWHAIVVPLKMSANTATLTYVGEWQPLHLDAMGLYALAALAAVLAVLARAPRRNLFRIIAVAALAWLMIRHARFVELFAVAGPVLAADAAARWPRLAPRPPAELATRSSAAIAALAAAVLVAATLIEPAPAASVTPDAAYRAAVAAGVDGPVYNDYDFGGYLIAHGVKTFVDGRTDQLFLGDFLPDLVNAQASPANAAFAALLARYHVTWALVRVGSRDAAHLSTMPGWQEIHADTVAAAFVLKR